MLKIILVSLVVSVSVSAAAQSSRLEEARALSTSLQEQLSSKLMAAMKAEGPVHAIGVCHVEAPEIAAQLSRDGEVEVGRTALRVRNPANAPQAEHREVMRDFTKALNKNPEVIPETLITLDNGEQHYLRAIVMQPQCAACHGKSIAPEVQAAITEKYPNDQATGFAVGELRGAFLIKWLSKEE